jgi:hypothetical protein
MEASFEILSTQNTTIEGDKARNMFDMTKKTAKKELMNGSPTQVSQFPSPENPYCSKTSSNQKNGPHASTDDIPKNINTHMRHSQEDPVQLYNVNESSLPSFQAENSPLMKRARAKSGFYEDKNDDAAVVNAFVDMRSSKLKISPPVVSFESGSHFPRKHSPMKKQTSDHSYQPYYIKPSNVYNGFRNTVVTSSIGTGPLDDQIHRHALFIKPTGIYETEYMRAYIKYPLEAYQIKSRF